jgi:hypothetical protein
MDWNLSSSPEKMFSVMNLQNSLYLEDELESVLLSRKVVLYDEFTVQPIPGGWT